MPGYYPPVTAKVSIAPVTADTVCRKCQYNLRGLLSDSLCPECGSAVSLSIREDLIEYSRPEYIRKLKSGALVLMIAVFVLLAASTFAIVNESMRLVNSAFNEVAFTVAEVISATGLWLITTKDPSGLGETLYSTSRKAARYCFLFGILSTCGASTYQLFNTTIIPPVVVLTVLGVCAVVGWIGTIFKLQYMSRLAVRLRDRPLARRAGFLRYALGIPMGILLCVTFLGRLAGMSGNAQLAANSIVLILAAISGLSLVVSGVIYFLLLDGLYNRLSKQLAIAQRASKI